MFIYWHIWLKRCNNSEYFAFVALQSSQARIAALYLPLLTIIIENKTRLQPKDSVPLPPSSAVNGDVLGDMTLPSRRSSTLGSYNSQMSLDQASLASGLSSVSQQRPPVRDPTVFGLISGQGYFCLYVVIGAAVSSISDLSCLVSLVCLFYAQLHTHQKEFCLLRIDFCAKVDIDYFIFNASVQPKCYSEYFLRLFYSSRMMHWTWYK